MTRRTYPRGPTPTRPGDGGPGSPPEIVFRLNRRFIPDSPAALNAWAEGDLKRLARLCHAPELIAALESLESPPVRPNMAMKAPRLLGLERRPEAMDDPRRRSLTQYWRMGLGARPHEVHRALMTLRSVPDVEAAWRQPLFAEPAVNPHDDPAFYKQRHLSEAPRGVGAEHAWKQNVRGQGVRFLDLERAWHKTSHVDLPGALTESGAIRVRWGDNLAGATVRRCSPTVAAVEALTGQHGIMALGIVLARDNKKGGIGLAPGATALGVVSYQLSLDAGDDDFGFTLSHLPTAIVEAANLLGTGGVLLLEAQALVADETACWAWPVEIFDDVRDAIQLAVKLGVTVVEPAGNNGIRLDDTDTSVNFSSTRYEDSGSILVSASTWVGDHHVEGAVNQGRRVDCFAEGDGLVTTSGDPSVSTSWTEEGAFSGTSGAAAVIAGVAVLAQSAAILSRGGPLPPPALRRLLGTAALGTEALTPLGGPSDQIGVMPNLPLVLAAIPTFSVT